MISFFTSKPILRDLIPSNYVDIHSHILPGIDDGAKVYEDSDFLISEMKSMGFSHCIATPHIFNGVWDNTKSIIEKVASQTNSQLISSFPDIKLKAAAEYLMDNHFLTLLQKNEILTLKDNYVLVEMSYINPPIQLYDIIFEIQVAGYKPILAHPERYFFYHDTIDEYKKLKKSGCSFQLNLLSTVGYYGTPVVKTANALLKLGLIDFVGSDIHHKNHVKAFSNPVLIKEIDSLKKSISNNAFFTF